MQQGGRCWRSHSWSVLGQAERQWFSGNRIYQRWVSCCNWSLVNYKVFRVSTFQTALGQLQFLVSIKLTIYGAALANTEKARRNKHMLHTVFVLCIGSPYILRPRFPGNELNIFAMWSMMIYIYIWQCGENQNWFVAHSWLVKRKWAHMSLPSVRYTICSNKATQSIYAPFDWSAIRPSILPLLVRQVNPCHAKDCHAASTREFIVC